MFLSRADWGIYKATLLARMGHAGQKALQLSVDTS